MEITFSDAKVRDTYCSRSILVREFSVEIARMICCRLAVLAAAQSLAQIPSAPPVGLMAVDRAGTFSVSLGSRHALVFEAIASGAAHAGDVSAISEIRIIGAKPVPVARESKK